MLYCSSLLLSNVVRGFARNCSGRSFILQKQQRFTVAGVFTATLAAFWETVIEVPEPQVVSQVGGGFLMYLCHSVFY